MILIGGIYGAMSYDIDHYTNTHPDMLILFAAGNSGSNGPNSINSPGNAKNVLTIGAAQLRDVLSDDLLISTEQSSIASFSSLGPTYDGRIKPDIITPGDFIMSAFAGSSKDVIEAMKPNGKIVKTCKYRIL